jgi:hypothetical protein
LKKLVTDKRSILFHGGINGEGNSFLILTPGGWQGPPGLVDLAPDRRLYCSTNKALVLLNLSSSLTLCTIGQPIFMQHKN